MLSRDLTPREAYEFERHIIENGGCSIFDSMQSTIVSYNGKTWPRYSEEEMAVRKQFPVLGRFLESFPALYERVSKYENGIEFLKAEDLCLQEYIATGNHNPGSYLVRWFEGELDDNFHYRERNDALLMESLCEEAMLHTGKQYDAYFEYRLNWYAAHGIDEADVKKLNTEYQEDVARGNFVGTFHQYELEFGYHGGEIYVCFDEFLDNEFKEIAQAREELAAFVKLVADDLLESDTIESNTVGYTLSNGNYHIFAYVDTIDEDKVYVVEPNKLVDGAHEPIGGTTYIVPFGDLEELAAAYRWCVSVFEEDSRECESLCLVDEILCDAHERVSSNVAEEVKSEIEKV